MGDKEGGSTVADRLKRREFLLSALATALLARCAPQERSPAEQAPNPSAPNAPDVSIELRAVKDDIPILPGKTTAVWRYRAKVLKGDAAAATELTDSYIGPVIRARRGQNVRIELVNELPESTVIHWHGLRVPDTMDGHPRFAIAPGQRYVYEFPVINRAGTYWFHPHPHGRTGKQVYAGLAGMFIVSDDEEESFGLPDGPWDLPIVIQDRTLDHDNQFVYLAADGSGGMMGRGMMGGGMRNMGSMMTSMMGFFGDRILINGHLDEEMSVERRPYRLRLLNGSNSRIYKLAWNDDSELTVIGNDGGLLEKPLQRRYVMLAPGERVDLWEDFGRLPAGAELRLQSLAFKGGGMEGGMMGGAMMQSSALPNGSPFPVVTLRVSGARTTGVLPKSFTVIPAPREQDAINAPSPRVFNITMDMMTWSINGRRFEMEAVSRDEIVKLGTQEIWEFRNDTSGGMMGTMAHSMHVHGLQFQVIGRSVTRELASARDSVAEGYVDSGWKDTVLVMPGERIRLLLGFRDYAGLFLYHCHMLEHEDTGLMRNYRINP
jgi:FtsP/CotA-like multicopper oxidase with cupredoxin domain